MSEDKTYPQQQIAELVEPDEEGGSPSVSDGQIEIPDQLPILGIDNFVLFPFMIAPMIIGEGHSKLLVDDALKRDRLLGVFLKKDSDKPEHFDNLYDVGTLAIILKMLRMPDGSVRLLLHGIDRIRIERHIAEEPYPKAQVERLEDINSESWPVKAMMRSIQNMITRIVKMGHLPDDLGASVNEITDPGKLADLAISHLSVKIEERQEVLELTDVEERLKRVLEILGREMKVLELGSEIQDKVMSNVDKRQREYMLREQIKAIQKELGEEEDGNPDLAELEEAVRKARMPKHAKDAAQKELKRLGMLHPSSPEYAVSRNYLDWMVSLPWSKNSRDNMNIDKAEKILDEDHYDLTEIKERILEYLAVIKLKKEIRGPILCFVGPPGVGKTSLGRSIARSLGRKFARMSLGGMRDEAEIRGHRRTYIGSMPGRIIKTLRDCATRNPLIMLDEIDKLGQDFRGDPASALLEVLDPEQNSTFTDHYLDMPFDLSNVMFITTANTLDAIPPALLDRMEVLKLSGYTAREKLEIAKRYLVPRAYENTGVTEKQAAFSDEGILAIVENYTREAGVRNLEREIQNVCRKVARRATQNELDGALQVGADTIREMLGPKRVYSEMAKRMGQTGVAIGLAWTPTGGEILFVEATAVPGGGQLLLTGQLGDVMKESGMAAVNFLHSHARELAIDEAAFSKQNFHVHVPAGATPKDGPSAGITLATALCSLLLRRPVRDYLAMTGEITLKGNVLPVGGIKEKVLAAYRAGIKDIILPTRARDALEKDIPDEVLEGMHYHFVDHIVEVLRIALVDGEKVIRIAPPRHEDKPEPRPEQQPEPRRDDQPEPEEKEERPASKDQQERPAGVVVTTQPAAEPESDAAPKVLKIEPDAKSSGSRRSRSRRGGASRSRRPKQSDSEEAPKQEEKKKESEETPPKAEEKAPDGKKQDAETPEEASKKKTTSRGRSRRSRSSSRNAAPKSAEKKEEAKKEDEKKEDTRKDEEKPRKKTTRRRRSTSRKKTEDKKE